MHMCLVVLIMHFVVCPQVGRDLSEVYWAPGNGAAFLDLVAQLTGRPLAADAWVAELQQPTDALVRVGGDMWAGCAWSNLALAVCVQQTARLGV